MLSRTSVSVGLALLLALVFAFPAFAGGWAVITLDELPADVIAGEPLTIGFTVRQHGVTLMDGLYPTVTSTLSKEEHLVVQAEADGKPGHYTATLTFPKEGNWEWSIQAFSMDQPMPTLRVAAPMATTAQQPVLKSEPVAVTLWPLLIVRVLALGLGLVALIMAYQRKSRLALSLTVLAVSIGLVSFMIGSTVPVAEAQTQGMEASELSIDTSPAQVEIGRQLFLAKGCITCHYNDRAADRDTYWTIDNGAPDLSRYSAHPEVLFIRLKDPTAAKSDAKMPDLELKKTEIEALIAFINSK
jgi:hypothetical protein